MTLKLIGLIIQHVHNVFTENNENMKTAVVAKLHGEGGGAEE